ncbi:MAG: DUF7483 domain-containing protein [Cyanophyceae cyanobacterium]
MFVGMGANSPSGYNITDSLRLRSSASAYLERTPTTAGDRQKYTFSFWIKLGKITTAQQIIYSSYSSNTVRDNIIMNQGSTGDYRFTFYSSVNNALVEPTAALRDPSAWYHITLAVDTTQATASNRVKWYYNGVLQTNMATATYPTLNGSTQINNTVKQVIGRFEYSSPSSYFDCYITEFNLVDGQQLDSSNFGEYNDDGVWSPIKYTGTYGTNGFYLPMKETTQAEGFNTVLYSGSGGASSAITGVGFSPDFVWLKGRNVANGHGLYDSVRGAGKRLLSHLTNAEDTVTGVSSFDSDGFSLASVYNTSGENYVAWCWDAGSSTVSNTDGTITSSVRANPDYGVSVVTYTGNANASATVGHGLGSAPEMVIVKRRNSTANWAVWHQNLSSYTHKLYLNTTDAEATGGNPIDAAPTSTVLELSSSGNSNASGGTYVAYCFSEVSGHSKFGSYTGTGATGNSVTTGFRPAFVMYKRTSGTANWVMVDNTRNPSNVAEKHLYPNLNNAENTATILTFDDNGFTINNTNIGTNGLNEEYIYWAIADTRDNQWNFDASGNKNNWTPNNINSNASSEITYDLMSDVPTLTDTDTSNFATLNPNDTYVSSVTTLLDGNLAATLGSSTAWRSAIATHKHSSGKWYYEVTCQSGNGFIGLGYDNFLTNGNNAYLGQTSGSYSYALGGNIYNGNSVIDSTPASFSSGDTVGVAADLDNNTVKWYKNGSLQTTTNITADKEYSFGFSNVSGNKTTINFGQRPFVGTLPTGYKKLNTFNLPNSDITDGSKYFAPVTYTGTGASQSITSLEFSPDFLWFKDRSATFGHILNDTIRGATKRLSSHSTGAEITTTNGLTSFNSDGFTIGDWAAVNTNTNSYVAWGWRGSDSTAVSNTDGTITSTVSANTTSGFSVVTYTATKVAGATVGHGLGAVPKMIICKNRDGAFSWTTYHASLGATKYLLLDSTAAAGTSVGAWNNTEPTSTVFTLGAAGEQVVGSNQLAYCFADVAGFSKFGSYTGNGSADGPFIHTGFRPAFILVKRTDGVPNWTLYDSARDTYNVVQNLLTPNTNGAEATYAIYDFVSNGFKLRNTDTAFNGSGANYIYMAFAENPFKNSNAR